MPTITPIHQLAPRALTTGGKSEIQSSAREKAIQALMQGTPSAPPTPIHQGQIDTNESASSPSSEPVESSAVETAEGQSEQPAQATSNEPSLSSQYAVLARKEKALRARVLAQDKSLKDKEAALIQREAAFKAKETEYSTKYIPKSRFSENPIEALSELGLSYDQLTQLALSAPSQQDMERIQYQRKVDTEIKALRDELERTKQQDVERQDNSYKQALHQIKSDVTALVDSDPMFETIKSTGSIPDVVELIERTYKKEGTLLSVEEAAQAVEEYLVEETFKLTKLKKIQDKLKLAAVAPATLPATSKSPSMKTLTNAATSSRQLSTRERAILAMKGELK